MKFRLGLDIGGTFTDLVLVDELGRNTSTKVPTTHNDLIEGLLHGLDVLASLLGTTSVRLIGSITSIVHGTTVATNAVLTQRGARTGLITTKGFRDILAMRRGLREVFYDNTYKAPEPLVPRYLRIGVPGRMDVRGTEIEPLDEKQVARACRLFAEEGVEAVAISFMHSYRNAAHEKRAEEIVRKELPEAFVTASCDVLPAIRFYDRTSTTVFNAYTGPIVGRYFSRLEAALREQGFTGSLLIMQSNGGITSPRQALKVPARLILSGPAAGPVAGIASASVLGFENLVVCDTGGTSFEVSLIRDGKPIMLREQDIDRRRLALPTLGIHTLGAGGGSVAWIDGGGLLQVGPRSAGSMPGPACYGRGGEEPTATDACLLLGYIAPDNFLAGRMPLRPDAAEAAVGRIAARLGIDTMAAARGIYEVMVANMAAGIQTVTVQRGHDPREFLMVAGGGAGPLFACRIARELQMPAILIPRHSSTLCAWGVLQSHLKHDEVASFACPVESFDFAGCNAALEAMREKGNALLAEQGVDLRQQTCIASADIRYIGQYDEISVPLPDGTVDEHGLARTLAAFHDTHNTLNGYSSPQEPCEIVALRMTAIGLVETLPPARHDANRMEKIGTRSIWVEGETARQEVPVYCGLALPAGTTIEGPAIVEMESSTLLLESEFAAQSDRAGNVLVYLRSRADMAGRAGGVE